MPEQSNLPTAPEKSISELFSTDPLLLTDADVDRMVTKLREARLIWEQEEISAKEQGRRPKADAAIKFEDLDI